MATIRNIVDRVDELRPNQYSEAMKLAWLSELEGKIAADVMLMRIDEIRNLEYSHPESMEAEPLVTYPHQEVYVYWLMAQIDFANGEYNKYQNSMEMYNQYFGNYVRWFANTYEPAKGYPDKVWPSGWEDPPYYLTAYGLAVKGGFQGSLEDWLASLKGEKGDKGDTGTNAYEYAVAGGYEGTEEEFAEVMAEQMTYLEDLVNLNKHLLNEENPHKVKAKQTGALSLKGEEAMQADLPMGGHKITGMAEPSEDADGATKGYADKKLALDGTTTMTGDLQLGNHRVKDVAAPAADGDAVNLGYVNENFAPAGFDNNGHDTVIAQGKSGIWTYRKWASGIAEVVCFSSITPTVSNAWAGGGHYSETLRFHLPFPSVGRITTVGTCSANIAYLSNISCNENDISFLICAPHEINKEAHYCSLYAAYRWK